MTVEQFNCSGSSGTSSEFALKRPYSCCGWDVPPESFSGTYTCTSAPPTIPTRYGCSGSKVSFTLPIVDYCQSGFVYRDPNYPEDGSIPLTIGLTLTTCLEPTRSVPPGKSGFSVGFLDFLNIDGVFTCNNSKFSFSGSGIGDDGTGVIYTVTVEINS